MRHAIHLTLACCVWSAQTLPISEWKEATETKSSGVWTLSMLVRSSEFTPDNLTALCNRLLAEDTGDYRLVSFTFGTIESGLWDVGYPGNESQAYERGLRYYAANLGEIATPAAQMIKIGAVARLRFRNGTNPSSIQVLGTEDPTLVTLGGGRFELIGFAFHALPLDYRLRSLSEPQQASIDLFMKDQKDLDPGRCQAAAAVLAASLLVPLVHVHFRNDTVFSLHGAPPVYPFVQQSPPLPLDRFLRTPEVDCTSELRVTTCKAWNVVGK